MYENREILLDFSNFSASVIGASHGITEAELIELKKHASEVLSIATTQYTQGQIGFMNLPFQSDSLDEILALANTHRHRWENLLVFGI